MASFETSDRVSAIAGRSRSREKRQQRERLELDIEMSLGTIIAREPREAPTIRLRFVPTRPPGLDRAAAGAVQQHRGRVKKRALEVTLASRGWMWRPNAQIQLRARITKRRSRIPQCARQLQRTLGCARVGDVREQRDLACVVDVMVDNAVQHRAHVVPATHDRPC